MVAVVQVLGLLLGLALVGLMVLLTMRDSGGGGRGPG